MFKYLSENKILVERTNLDMESLDEILLTKIIKFITDSKYYVFMFKIEEYNNLELQGIIQIINNVVKRLNDFVHNDYILEYFPNHILFMLEKKIKKK